MLDSAGADSSEVVSSWDVSSPLSSDVLSGEGESVESGIGGGGEGSEGPGSGR